MTTNERRIQILSDIKSRGTEPITASDLAKKYGVTRQVIVQDVALLRAKGNSIIATPNGYQFYVPYLSAASRVIFSKHSTMALLRQELDTIVSMGGRVLDVSVEHAIYGEFRAMLMISTTAQVEDFVLRLTESNDKPLSAVTDGEHYHIIEAKDEATLDAIELALGKLGLLM